MVKDIFNGFCEFCGKDVGNLEREQRERGWYLGRVRAVASSIPSLPLSLSPSGVARHCSGDISAAGVAELRAERKAVGSQLSVTRCLRRQRGSRDA